MARPTAALLAACMVWLGAMVSAQVRLADESDRAAFRAWFVLLADAQFERTTDDVGDCAALVRHAVREALRAHTPEWVRRSGLPFTPQFADVRSAPKVTTGDNLPLFRITAGMTPRYAEFADAKTLIRYNTRPLGRDVRALRPGDLLYFHQPGQSEPDHLMVFVGTSQFDSDGDDWVVYHTGPSGAPSRDGGKGEVRKVRLSTLRQHPAPRWRPLTANQNFVGVFRLNIL
jgi:uncharacterized protein YfaT (DUF1175 family)